MNRLISKDSKKESRNSLDILSFPKIVIITILGIFIFFSWFVSSPVRAARIDSFILYNTDEVFRFYFVRLSLHSAYAFVNSYVRPVYMIVSSIFYNLLPFQMFSLRLMNALFSCGTLYIIWRLIRRIGFEDRAAVLAIMLIATNPIYFLHSISIHAANIFCFFLMVSAYLFYRKEYLLSVVFSSLLPLIRPEGYLSLVILPILLLNEKKLNIRYLVVLFSPLFVWMGMNRLLLGDGLLSRFSYQSLMLSNNVYGKNPLDGFALRFPDIVITPPEFLLSSGYFAFILFLIGFIYRIFDKKYVFLSSSFIVYFLFYSFFSIAINFGLEKVNIHGTMAITSAPIVPFMGIFAIVPIAILIKRKSIGWITVYICAAAFVISNISQIIAFQRDPRLKWRALYSLAEEQVLKQAGSWLGEYAVEKGINKLYVSVDDVTQKFTNSFLLYLPPGLKFYMVSAQKGSIALLDLEMVKALPFEKENAIYLSSDRNSVNLSNKVKCEPIKEFGPASLYFYLLK